MEKDELLVRYAPQILLRLKCPHCGKQIEVKYRWTPEVEYIK